MANEVKFTINITDNGSAKTVTADAEELGKTIDSVKQEAEKFTAETVKWANAAQAVETFEQSITTLRDTCTALTDAYQAQIVAETKLDTIMQQRMGATADNVKAIKELCAAQQQIGVIGDEVQLAGAQQIATYINQQASLEQLIPAMNNLIAQQKGFNASQEDATSIGNMMGKAMQGQTDVLKEVGITFTDAQATIIKYGTEQQRAATIAQVITDNVGQMNQQLAMTDAGKQVQLNNTLGDIKESMGGMVQAAMPFVEFAAMTAMAVSGAVKFHASLMAIISAHSIMSVKTAVVTAATKAWTIAQTALNAVMSANPIGLVVIAIGALVAAAVAAYNNFKPFKDCVDSVWAAIKQLAQAVGNALEPYFRKLCATIQQAWAYLKQLFGWDDPVKNVTQSTAKATENTDELAKALKKLEEQGKKTKVKTQIEQPKPIKGSIEYQENIIGNLEKQLKNATTTEKRLEINAQIAVERKELDRIQNVIDKANNIIKLKTELKPIEGAKIKTALNMGNIKKEAEKSMINTQKQIQEQIKITANEAAKQKKTMADAASGISDSFSALANATGQPIFAGLSKGIVMAQAIAIMIEKLKSCVTVWDYIAAIGGGTAAVISAFASMPAFANGGIVYGPTVGLIGEYAGAANNPEVIAPLDKLKSIINPQQNITGSVQFKIKGNDLVAILQQQKKINALTLNP